MSPENSELVSQRDDLEVLGASRTDSETGQRSEESVQDAIHASQDRCYLPWSTPPVRVSGTHRQRTAVIVGSGFEYGPASALQLGR